MRPMLPLAAPSYNGIGDCYTVDSVIMSETNRRTVRPPALFGTVNKRLQRSSQSTVQGDGRLAGANSLNRNVTRHKLVF